MCINPISCACAGVAAGVVDWGNLTLPGPFWLLVGGCTTACLLLLLLLSLLL